MLLFWTQMSNAVLMIVWRIFIKIVCERKVVDCISSLREVL